MARMSSTIWVASSRVGARIRAVGRGAVGLDAVGDRMPKASVLPEPVGDFGEHVAPLEHLGDHLALDGKRLCEALLASELTTARETPRSAKD